VTGSRPLFAEPLPPLDVSGRLDRLRETLPDAGVDGLLVTAAANIRWLTGFTG
jgi:Xaa-Pro aminopeptidase